MKKTIYAYIATVTFALTACADLDQSSISSVAFRESSSKIA